MGIIKTHDITLYGSTGEFKFYVPNEETNNILNTHKLQISHRQWEK